MVYRLTVLITFAVLSARDSWKMCEMMTSQAMDDVNDVG